MFGLVHEHPDSGLESGKADDGTAGVGAGELQRRGGQYYQGTRVVRRDVMAADQPVPGSHYWQALNRNNKLHKTDI